MVAPLPCLCLAPNQSFNPNRITLHNHVVVCSIISCNHRNWETVDSNKVRPLVFGDAIATLTTNTTKPTKLTRLGGFVCIENLSIH
jgi:hypothetical protein